MNHDTRHLKRRLRHEIRHELRRRLPHYELARALSWGGVLIAVGLAWLLKGEGAWFDGDAWRTLVPGAFVWSGLVLALVVRRAWAVVTGLQRIAIGAWLYIVLQGFFGWTLWQTWPVVLVAIGVAIVARGLLEPDGAWCGPFDGSAADRAAPPPASPASPASPIREESVQ